MAHSRRADQTPDANPDTAPSTPMPATLTTARALIRRLRADLATTQTWLREATAYIDVVERERDDAFADADHWREQAAQTVQTAQTAGEVLA
jgi:hypothetical protein